MVFCISRWRCRTPWTSASSAFNVVLKRDLRIAFRRVSELANPLLFFVIVASLFPLALSPDPVQLRNVGTGVLWVAALLSSLLALEGFRPVVDECVSCASRPPESALIAFDLEAGGTLCAS